MNKNAFPRSFLNQLKASRLISLCLLAVAFPAMAQSEGEISSIDFESIPPATRMSGSPITLDARTIVNGEVETNTGIRFPDGSLQTTARAEGLTANQGLYDNRIVAMMPPFPYTEICFVGGNLLFEIHEGGESTEGGDCVPGNVGWIIERSERDGSADTPWEEARLSCLLDGMRLPEPFEWKIACSREDMLGLSGFITGGAEWVSNTVRPTTPQVDVEAGSAVLTFGEFGTLQGCGFGAVGFVTRGPTGPNAHQYRCVR